MPTPTPIPVFDLHCDTADRIAWHALSDDLKAVLGKGFYGRSDAADPAGARSLARNHCHVSLEKVGALRLAQCFACFVPDELSPEQAARFYDQVCTYFGGELARNAATVVPVRTMGELRAVLEPCAAAEPREGRGAEDANRPNAPHVAALRTIENARMFAADLRLVGRYAASGLLMASLSWNAPGPLACGPDAHEGLSELGRAALGEMERHHVVLDVSHLNDECFADVARLTTRPFVASHSNARAVCNHPRNLTDRQFAEIRERGGLVGLNYCGGFLVEGAWGDAAAQVTFEQTVAHVEHWLDLGGQDVVALGGDLDGARVPAFLDGADKLPAFADALVDRFGEHLARKLCYENALAFFERTER